MPYLCETGEESPSRKKKCDSVIENSESVNMKQQNKQKHCDVCQHVAEESQPEDRGDQQKGYLSESFERRMRKKKKKHKKKHNGLETDEDLSETPPCNKRKCKKKHKDIIKGYEDVHEQDKENGEFTREQENKKVKHKKKCKDHEIVDSLTKRHKLENNEHKQLENAKQKHKKKNKETCKELIQVTGNTGEDTEPKKVKHKKKHRKDLEKCESVNIQKDEVGELNVQWRENLQELGISASKSNEKSTHDFHVIGEVIIQSECQKNKTKKKHKHHTADGGESNDVSVKIKHKRKHNDCVGEDGFKEEDNVKVKRKKKKHCKESETINEKEELEFGKPENAMHKKKHKQSESGGDEYVHERHRHKKKHKHCYEGSENVKVKQKKKCKQDLKENRGTLLKQREQDVDSRGVGDVTMQHETVLTAAKAKWKKCNKDDKIVQQATNLCLHDLASENVIDLTETIDQSDTKQAEELQESCVKKRRRYEHDENIEDDSHHIDRNRTTDKINGEQDGLTNIQQSGSHEDDEVKIEILSDSENDVPECLMKLSNRNSDGTLCDMLHQNETLQQQADDYTWTAAEEKQLRMNWERYLQNHPFDEADHLLIIPEDMPLEKKRSIWKISRETNLLESLAHGIDKPLAVVRDKARSLFVQKTPASQRSSTLSVWSPTEIKQLEKNWHQFFMDHPMDNPYELLSPLHLLSKERHKWLIKFKKEKSFMERLRQGINRSALSVYHKAKRHFCPYTEVTGSLSEDEILQLKKLITVHGNKLLLISTLMGRSPTCIEFHFNQLKRLEKNYITGKWTAEEKQRLIEAVQEQVGFDITDKEKCHDRKRFSQLDWCAIAEKVQTRDMYQCFHKWMFTDCIQNYKKPPDDSHEKLLFKLIEEQNVEEARDIDWLAIYEQMKIMPSPNSVKRLFWKMCRIIPNRENKTHKEMMAILRRIYGHGTAMPAVVSCL